MDATWHSLYLPTTDREAAVAALRDLLAARGYAPFDPFPGGTGTPPGHTSNVRQFAAPPQDGWLRLLGEPVADVLPELSRALNLPVIYGWLTDDSGGFALYQDGARHLEAAAFEPFLAPGITPQDVQTAFAGKLSVAAIESGGEIEQFAQQQGVDQKKAAKLAARMSGKLLGGLVGSGESRAEQDQARAVLMGGGRDPWNSLHGQRVRAIAGVLKLPANWRLPSFEAVRDAYQVNRLRQRSPRMTLMPGDMDALKAVPDALEYTPIYMGK